MKQLSNISSVYFLGIGGIGMSALARYFNELGAAVSGYDKTASALTDELIAEGIEIHFEDDVALANKNAELVIYTPAIPSTHSELNWFRDNNIELFKRSDVLGSITADHFSICVAGTHGKTTTSAMIGYILRHTGYGANAFLGGIAANYNTNFWSHENKTAVAEADEYDRSFLKLRPDIAVITAMDADHLDIYGTEENMQDAFIEFSQKIKEGGVLFLKAGIARANDFRAAKIFSYSLKDSSADVHAVNLRSENGSWFFDAVTPVATLKDIELPMGGAHNAENGLVAIAVAMHLKIDAERIRAAVAHFRGVRRRFEYILRNERTVMIDDYAHHPEELRALIMSAKEMFPGKKCTVVFQPHLFSRTRDFAAGFAEVLSLPDETILLPIYPARELPIAGVNSKMIADNITNNNTRLIEKEALVKYLNEHRPELLIMAGAGDIDTLVEPVKKMIA